MADRLSPELEKVALEAAVTTKLYTAAFMEFEAECQRGDAPRLERATGKVHDALQNLLDAKVALATVAKREIAQS